MPSVYEFIVEMKDQVSGAASSAGSALTGMLGPASAVIAALGAVTGAATVVGGALFETSKLALEAGRSKQKLVDAFSAFTGSEKAGKATLDVIRQLERDVPQNDAQLASWARKLEGAGTTDMSKLKDQLTAIAAAGELIPGASAKVLSTITKLQSQAAGGKVKFNAAKLIGTGVTEQELLAQLGMTPKAFDLARKQGTITGQQIADAMTAALKAKGAPALKAAALDLGNQWGKVKDQVTRLFEDVNPTPFLEGVRKLIDFGGAGGTVFKFLQQTVTKVFNTVFSIASKVLPYVRQFLLGLAIGAVKFWIAIQPAVAKIGELFGSVNAGGPGTMAFFLRLGEVVGDVAVAFVNTIVAVAKAIGWVMNFAKQAKEAGENLIGGLVAGITGGVGRVVDAAKGVASGAVDAFKNALGIHSDSRVMMGVGEHTAGGFQTGIEKGSGDAQAAMLSLTSPPRPAQSSGSTGGGGNITWTGNIIVQGAANARETAEMVKHEVADMFEQLQLMQGG